jgi:hypothetical protein
MTYHLVFEKATALDGGVKYMKAPQCASPRNRSHARLVFVSMFQVDLWLFWGRN